jgi:hypothetical protein
VCCVIVLRTFLLLVLAISLSNIHFFYNNYQFSITIMPFTRPSTVMLLVYTIMALISSGILLVVLSITTTHWIHTSRVQAGLWQLCHLQPLACFHSFARSPTFLTLTGLSLIILGLISTIMFDLFDYQLSLSRRYLSFMSVCSLGFGSLGLLMGYIAYARLVGQFCYSFYSIIIAQWLIMIAAIFSSYLQGRRHILATTSIIMTRLDVRKS